MATRVAGVLMEIEKQVISGASGLDPLAVNVTVTDGVVTVSGYIDREPVALILVAGRRQVHGVLRITEQLSYMQR